MGFTKYHLLFLLFISLSFCAMAQKEREKFQSTRNLKNSNVFAGNYINVGDSVFIFMGICKNSGFVLLNNNVGLPTETSLIIPDESFSDIMVHGNVLYNFTYRSYIDTPFAQNDLMQHTVQTTLNFVLKNKYPFKVIIGNRSSNSPYFKNATNVSLQFNRSQLIDNLRMDLKRKALEDIAKEGKEALLSTQKRLEQQQQQAKQLNVWLHSSARAEEFVEAKEKELRIANSIKQSVEINDNLKKELNPKKTFDEQIANNRLSNDKSWSALEDKLQNKINDSLKSVANNNQSTLLESSLLEKYDARKMQLKKLQDSVKNTETMVRSLKGKLKDSVAKLNEEINKLKNPDEIYAFMKKRGINKSILTKTQKVLLAINKIGLGRNWIDYSELTSKNVVLSGVNIEANPVPFYFAFAGGKLNYQFRDFVLKNNKSLPDQSLYIARAGVGNKEKNIFILSFFNGTKSILNYTSTNSPEKGQRIIGLSAELKMRLNENNYVVGEIAKSSFNSNSNTSAGSNHLFRKVVNFKNRTNEAYSIKLFSLLPVSNTRISAYFRKNGENFQSFNLYSINIGEEAWMLKANQSFFKNKLVVEGSVRKNDFVSPILAPSMSSKTVFKSAMATLKIPKYPIISLGYYPTTQLFQGVNNSLYESQYNTFNAVLSHSYKVKNTSMNTSVMYTKFYNNSSDSGFNYFDAGNFTMTQNIFIFPFTLQTSVSKMEQMRLQLFSLEEIVSYHIKKRLSLSGGIKWNKVREGENLFGATGAATLFLGKLGSIQFNFSKTYIPTYIGLLRPVDIGGVTYCRDF
ncbi:MAG: hypothetical protein V4556_08380 [Bacteroidota bacterium]